MRLIRLHSAPFFKRIPEVHRASSFTTKTGVLASRKSNGAQTHLQVVVCWCGMAVRTFGGLGVSGLKDKAIKTRSQLNVAENGSSLK